MTTEQSKALLDAEQPQPDLLLVLVMESNGRVKPDALVAHVDMNGVVGPNLEVDIDPIDMGVLDRVEQQLADRLKEQDANITCRPGWLGGRRSHSRRLRTALASVLPTMPRRQAGHQCAAWEGRDSHSVYVPPPSLR